LNAELKTNFFSNLKITAKVAGTAFLALSAMTIFDSMKTANKEGLLLPLYLLAFLSPVMLLGVYMYTLLAVSSMHKYLCSIVFGASISVCIMFMYLLSEVLHYQSINLRFAGVSALFLFICLSGIYLQLPWRKHA
jgi:hypothetical protein